MIYDVKKPQHIGDRLKLFMEENKLDEQQVADYFGIKRPSVYDWIKFGRMHKRHYGKLAQWSKLSVEYWLGIPVQNITHNTEHQVSENKTPYMTPRLTALVELFESVTKADQEEVIRALTEKKQGYEALIKELLEKRA